MEENGANKIVVSTACMKLHPLAPRVTYLGVGEEDVIRFTF